MGPLVVQRPFYPEGNECAHVYLIHPPGGVVGGDSLALDVRVTGGAGALLTTPAATKLYRSPSGAAQVTQELLVDEGRLEWLPGETIAFDGADAELATAVRIAGGARFFGWEICTLGRQAGSQPFVEGRLRQRFGLLVDDRPVATERAFLSGSSLGSVLGLRRARGYGTVLAYPATATDLASCRAALAGTPTAAFVAATLVDGALVVRALGDAPDVRTSFEAVWRAARPTVIGAEATAPRIWRT